VGIVIRSVDISIGDVTVNSNEGLLERKKSSSESSSDSQKSIGSNVDPKSTKPPTNKQEKIAGYISKFPQKVEKLYMLLFFIYSNDFIYFSSPGAHIVDL